MAKMFYRVLLVAILFLSCIDWTEEARNKRMEGLHFKTATCEAPVGLKLHRSSNGTIIGYSGSFVTLFDWLSKRLKFTYTTIPVVKHMTEPLPNGSWIGTYDLLMKKEVDFSTCLVLLSPRVSDILDVTATVLETPDVLLIPPPREESRLLAPVKPFTLTVWLVLLGCTILLSIAILWIHYFKSKITGNTGNVLTLQNVTVSITTVTFGQAEFPLDWSKSLSLRMIITAFCLSAVVLINSYTGSFISFATAPKLIPLAENSADVAFRSNLRWVGTYAQNYDTLIDSPRPALRLLAESVKKDPRYFFQNAASAAEKVATGCCALLFPKIALDTWLSYDLKKRGYCRCMITKEVEAVDFYAVGTQKGSPYREPMTIAVLEAREFGLVEGWLRNEVRMPERCYNPEPPKIRPLKLSDLSGVFLFYVGGVSFSVTLLIIEIIKHKFMKWKSQPRQYRGLLKKTGEKP